MQEQQPASYEALPKKKVQAKGGYYEMTDEEFENEYQKQLKMIEQQEQEIK